LRSDSCFAVCAPGLEPLTAAELAALGIASTTERGGVSFHADAHSLLRANLHLRTATRVLLRLGSFRARSFAELERRARTVPWERLLRPDTPYRLRVSCAKSKLYHEGAVAERLQGVIEARTGARPAAESEVAPATDDEAYAAEDAPAASDSEARAADAQLLVIRFFRDMCTVSADSSGAPLHMRGYRQELAKAPLRETLAAAMLLASRWPMDVLLMDPFCGSGTIPIEAALLARRIPPGLASPGLTPRSFGFQSWPDHASAAWAECVSRAQERVLANAAAPILGFDKDPGAIRAARANAMRAGVQADVELRERAFEHVPPAASGWLVTNPPYGVRVGDRTESQGLFARLGKLARSYPSWTVCALAPEGALGRTLGEPARGILRTRTGGIAVELVQRVGKGADELAADPAEADGVPRKPTS
jgi:putative N6-adenine-specific DNA methylase